MWYPLCPTSSSRRGTRFKCVAEGLGFNVWPTTYISIINVRAQLNHGTETNYIYIYIFICIILCIYIYIYMYIFRYMYLYSTHVQNNLPGRLACKFPYLAYMFPIFPFHLDFFRLLFVLFFSGRARDRFKDGGVELQRYRLPSLHGLIFRTCRTTGKIRNKSQQNVNTLMISRP